MKASHLIGAAVLISAASSSFSAGPAAPPASIQFTTVWIGMAPNCPSPSIQSLPGQPQVGLVAYKTRCPGDAKDRVVSARVSARAHAFVTTSPLARGASPNLATLEKREIDIQTPAQWPLDQASLELVSARRDLSAGAILAARDFEAKMLWRGGDAVAIKSRVGMVNIETQGVATSVGREGQRSSAKLENGKIIEGVARVGASGPWMQMGHP